MKKVIIFGIQDFAELAHYYLTNDSEYEVVAFCVNEEYMPNEKSFKGLPIVSFENLEEHYSPSQFSLFAPMAPKKMNTIREKVYLEGKEKGYSYISYISSKATIFNSKIGDNCFILENNTIQPFTNIGNNVIMWSGNHIGHHGKIEDNVMFTSHVVLSGHCVVEKNCFFGVNATIRDGLTLAKGSLIAMAASVTKNTEEWSIYVGNPAKKLDNKNSLDLNI
ncbi:acetyltransferase (plasmid) [Bernardetia sp. Wsw4-3y2]|uniref:acetyltransferase n=1 Tax=Bernardetia sp. Wsw4-3y2 TaxID=3127471 RepID=UPI0030D3BEC5